MEQGGWEIENLDLKTENWILDTGNWTTDHPTTRRVRSIIVYGILPVAELERKQVALQVLDQNIDTNSATGRLLFNMLGAIAQFETEIRAERQREGIQKARERGVRFGKQKTLNPKQVAELQERRQRGVLIKTLMQDYGLSKTSVYRYLKKEVSTEK